MSQRHSDDLFRFSYRIFKIEYIILKIFFLALSLYGLYKLAKEEFGFSISTAHVERTDSATKNDPPRSP